MSTELHPAPPLPPEPLPPPETLPQPVLPRRAPSLGAELSLAPTPSLTPHATSSPAGIQEDEEPSSPTMSPKLPSPQASPTKPFSQLPPPIIRGLSANIDSPVLSPSSPSLTRPPPTPTSHGLPSDLSSPVYSPSLTRPLTPSSLQRGSKLLRVSTRTGASSDADADVPGHTQCVRCVAFSADGRLLASCGDDASVRLWDGAVAAAAALPAPAPGAAPAAAALPLQLLVGHADAVRCVAFRPDGRRLASCGDDASVRLWDAGSGACLAVLGDAKAGIVYALAFSPATVSYVGKPAPSKLATASADKAVRVFDEISGRCEALLRGHGHWVTAVTFSPDGLRLATGSWDKTVRVWPLADKTRRSSMVLKGHRHWVLGVAWSPDGKRLASCSSDKGCRLWDVSAAGGGRCTGELLGHGHWVSAVAFSPDGKRLATASWDRNIKVWDVTGAVASCTLTLEGLQWVMSVAWSPDGSRLASGGNDRLVRVWELSSGRCIATL